MTLGTRLSKNGGFTTLYRVGAAMLLAVPR